MKILILTDAPSFTNTNSNTHLKYCYLQTHHPPTPSEANLRCHKLIMMIQFCAWLNVHMPWYFIRYYSIKWLYSPHLQTMLFSPQSESLEQASASAPWSPWYHNRHDYHDLMFKNIIISEHLLVMKIITDSNVFTYIDSPLHSCLVGCPVCQNL